MRLFHSERPVFDHVMKGAKVSAQVTANLRAVRPFNAQPSEHVDFHRESFFNPDMAHAWNIWIPIRNVTPDNAPKFVPDSQLIPNAEIGTVNSGEQTGLVKRYAAGHKIGLLYDPIHIVSGVDFSTVETLYVPPGHIALFNANLIHGAGINETGKIRFSLDFSIIPTKKIQHRDYSFAADGEYFAELG
jgi:ectoine hydroxylase-related dioxygenase (phytanoyl-CoA dioxygenase family)